MSDKILGTNLLPILKDEFLPRLNDGFYRNSGYTDANNRYFEIFVMKSSDDVGNGGSILLEAMFGDFGNQCYCQLQISTREGLKIAGIKNGIYTGQSDLLITKDSEGMYHFYLKQFANKWCQDNIIVKKYADGILVSINKYLPSPTSKYTGSPVWQYSTDDKLLGINVASYQLAKATKNNIEDLRGGVRKLANFFSLFPKLKRGVNYGN